MCFFFRSAAGGSALQHGVERTDGVRVFSGDARRQQPNIKGRLSGRPFDFTYAQKLGRDFLDVACEGLHHFPVLDMCTCNGPRVFQVLIKVFLKVVFGLQHRFP